MSAQPDVIIVGGGTAGSIIARRLLDAGKTVHLLEAGRPDENPAIHDMSRLGELWFSPDDWGYHTTPQPGANGRKLHWPRGRVLGGSHSLNASIYVRGNRLDYDGWEAAGCPGWGWKSVEKIFTDKIESWQGEPNELGTKGILDVTTDYPKHPIQDSILVAGQQQGLKLNPNYNGVEIEGIGQEQLNFRNGERLSTYRAYLHPVRDNANLTITTGAWVHRLILEGTTVVGVVYEKDGQTHELRGGEVALAGGALDSPRILLLSGIGPKADLEALGIDVVADVPGVGANLHDHLLVPMVYTTSKKPIGAPPRGVPISQVHWFWKSRPELDRPDTQPLCFSVPMVTDTMKPEDIPADGFTMFAALVTPKSRGTFKLSSADPHAATLQDPQILTHPDDIATLIASVKQVREVGKQAALAEEWGATEAAMSADLQTDEQIEFWCRNNAITYHHQVGTAKMGTDPMAVVSPTSLKVHGLEGVRVVDASVMPTVTNGNTNAPSMIIGEKAAEFIIAGA